MHPYITQSLVQEHIKESQRQAAAIRRVSAARASQRRTARRFAHRTTRGA
jgi:hypothetical protein